MDHLVKDLQSSQATKRGVLLEVDTSCASPDEHEFGGAPEIPQPHRPCNKYPRSGRCLYTWQKKRLQDGSSQSRTSQATPAFATKAPQHLVGEGEADDVEALVRSPAAETTQLGNLFKTRPLTPSRKMDDGQSIHDLEPTHKFASRMSTCSLNIPGM